MSLKSEKNFVDGRTAGRTFPPPLILLGQLLEVDLINGGILSDNENKYLIEGKNIARCISPNFTQTM